MYGVVYKWCHQLRGEGIICQEKTLLHMPISWNGWQLRGRVKNIKKWVMPLMDGPYIKFFKYMKKHHLHVSRTQIDSVKETSLNNLIPFSSFHLFGNGSHSFFQLVTSYLGSLQNRKNTQCKKIDKKLFNLVCSLCEEKMLKKCWCKHIDIIFDFMHNLFIFFGTPWSLKVITKKVLVPSNHTSIQ